MRRIRGHRFDQFAKEVVALTLAVVLAGAVGVELLSRPSDSTTATLTASALDKTPGPTTTTAAGHTSAGSASSNGPGTSDGGHPHVTTTTLADPATTTSAPGTAGQDSSAPSPAPARPPVRTAASGPAPAPPPPARVTSVSLGVYAGAGNRGGIASFASDTGAAMAIAGDYQNGSTWSTIDSSYPASTWSGSGYRLALGVDMLPNSGASLAAGASGAYNGYFTTLAQNLVSVGAANAILRIGWEWDQSSNPWYVSNATDAANFAAYWRQIVTAMRAVPGADFDYAWYYGDGGSGITAAAYPGSGYVSSVTLDFYDQTWDGSCGLAFDNTSTPAQSECAWSGTYAPELAGFASFAAANGEPMGFGEWGVISRSDGHGLGDDPTFVDNFASWVGSHDVAYADYFDANSGGNSILTDYPGSLAAFRAAF